MQNFIRHKLFLEGQWGTSLKFQTKIIKQQKYRLSQLIWESVPYPNVMLGSARDLTNIPVDYPYWRLEIKFMSQIRLGIILWDGKNLARSWKFDRMTSIKSKWMDLGEWLWEIENFWEISHLSIPAQAHLINFLIKSILIFLQGKRIKLPHLTLRGKTSYQTVKLLQQTFNPQHQQRRHPQTPQPRPVLKEAALYKALVEHQWDVQPEFDEQILYWKILSLNCINSYRTL